MPDRIFDRKARGLGRGFFYACMHQIGALHASLVKGHIIKSGASP